MLFGYEYEVYLKILLLFILTFVAFILVEFIKNKSLKAIDESPRWKFLRESQYDKIFDFFKRLTKQWKQ